jgi:Protein of unknown function (DUF1549)/Protein of unknown function (DUF1553)/GHMP kinases C terminal
MRYGNLSLLLLVAILSAVPARAEEPVSAVVADPAAVRLTGPKAVHSLLIHGKTASGAVLDLTHAAHYRTVDPKIATVNDSGVIRGVADGSTTVEVEAAGRKVSVAVTVKGAAEPWRFNFENDVIPLFGRFGCNSSGCHGKAEGQNGFKLSVFGFDPAADYTALVKEGRGRRIMPAAPDASLLLAKMSGGVPHGGGVRIPKNSAEYQTIRDWIAAGLPYGNADDPKVTAVRVEPSERQLAMHGSQQLRVIARWSDGREADVTAHGRFQSNNDGLASVSAGGLVSAAEVPGEAAIMVSYMNAVDVFRAVVPRAESITKWPDLPENNFIDGLVYKKLRKLNVLPSETCDDADYLRRVYLDVIGTLPTPEETRRFLDDKRPDRRARLVDELLDRPEYADYWALKWADLLRIDRQALGHKRAYGYYKWVRESLAENKPYDRFVREIVTAEGPLSEVGPASFYKAVTKPGEAASTLSQVFLGVRIACAECHHHPFDRWSQSDYFGMQAFFAPVAVRGGPRDEVLSASGAAEAKNPRTGETSLAHALAVSAPKEAPKGDPRPTLADWMTAPDNPWFARNLANRMWAHFLGRGIVEPVDDVRATNPPTNPELLDALAKSFVESKYDLKKLIRTITASRVYQLSSKPNATNERDEQNGSRALFRRIDAEVLLDMVCQTTGVPEKFSGVPAGSRAIQLWDSKVPHYFLKLFGRPVRASACECERVKEPGVAQVLHLLNSPEIHAKLSHDGGTVAMLVKEKADDAALAEELYLTFYCRYPTEKEKKVAVDYLKENGGKRREAAEDLAWSLMNSLEFVFNH